MDNQHEDKKSFWKRETYWTLAARLVIVAALSYWILKLFMPQAMAFWVSLGLVAVIIVAAIIRKSVKIKK